MSHQIIRIVKMTFKPESVDQFLVHFNDIKDHIRSFQGCNALKLIRSEDQTNVFFTYSIWDDPADLENYRNSDLFKETWTYVKQLFENRAEAWTTKLIVEL